MSTLAVDLALLARAWTIPLLAVLSLYYLALVLLKRRDIDAPIRYPGHEFLDGVTRRYFEVHPITRREYPGQEFVEALHPLLLSLLLLSALLTVIDSLRALYVNFGWPSALMAVAFLSVGASAIFLLGWVRQDLETTGVLVAVSVVLIAINSLYGVHVRAGWPWASTCVAGASLLAFGARAFVDNDETQLLLTVSALGAVAAIYSWYAVYVYYGWALALAFIALVLLPAIGLEAWLNGVVWALGASAVTLLLYFAWLGLRFAWLGLQRMPASGNHWVFVALVFALACIAVPPLLGYFVLSRGRTLLALPVLLGEAVVVVCISVAVQSVEACLLLGTGLLVGFSDVLTPNRRGSLSSAYVKQHDLIDLLCSPLVAVTGAFLAAWFAHRFLGLADVAPVVLLGLAASITIVWLYRYLQPGNYYLSVGRTCPRCGRHGFCPYEIRCPRCGRVQCNHCGPHKCAACGARMKHGDHHRGFFDEWYYP